MSLFQIQRKGYLRNRVNSNIPQKPRCTIDVGGGKVHRFIRRRFVSMSTRKLFAFGYQSVAPAKDRKTGYYASRRKVFAISRASGHEFPHALAQEPDAMRRLLAQPSASSLRMRRPLNCARVSPTHRRVVISSMSGARQRRGAF